MKKVIAANWKMNKTREQAHQFFQEFAEKNLETTTKLQGSRATREVLQKDVVFCVPFTALGIAREYADEKGFTVGAQNFHPAKSGAYTGEISAEMLIEVGAKVVLIGHSERRALFGETDDFINQKVKAALNNGLYVILCIGETLDEREGNKTEKVLAAQLQKALDGVELSQAEQYILVVAYEPVWAIGTGKVATLEQIEATHKFVKKQLKKLYPDVTIPVLYGGSANEKNAAEILAVKGVDGVLVGGAALDAGKFAAIINS